ncbi:MAG: RecX family transcriptional regulator, partial [Oscillospiraceae bacterium]|nr:RecX family transcriptional regulator [Oscillospiraceae bacterium]
MTITDITMTKRGRYALFCDEEFVFSIDEETYVDFTVHKGMEVDEQLLNELKDKSEIVSAKAKAYELLSYRAHTKKELRDKLKKRFDEYTADFVVDSVEALGYIDEEKYVYDCLDYLFGSKKYSVIQAKRYLFERGIEREMLEEILVEYDIDETDNIYSIVESRYMSKLNENNG